MSTPSNVPFPPIYHNLPHPSSPPLLWYSLRFAALVSLLAYIYSPSHRLSCKFVACNSLWRGFKLYTRSLHGSWCGNLYVDIAISFLYSCKRHTVSYFETSSSPYELRSSALFVKLGSLKHKLKKNQNSKRSFNCIIRWSGLLCLSLLSGA